MSRDLVSLLSDDQPYACTLSGDLLLKAQKELHEKPEWRLRDVDGLRQMIRKEDGLHVCLTDSFLLRFLRSRKFDYDRAFQLVSNYYSVRHSHAEVFVDLLPSKLEHVFRDQLISVLPHVDYHGRRVLWIDLGKWKTETHSFDDIVRALLLALELEVCQEHSQVCGISVLMDLRGLTLAQIMTHLKPAVVKRVSALLQNSFPMRLKAVHLIHESTVLDVLITLVKPFMTDKLRQRLHFHGSSMHSLHLHMDPEVLPEGLGGSPSNSSLSPDEASARVEESFSTRVITSESYFVELNKFPGYTRPPPPSSPSDDGSPFRSVLTTYKRFCIDGLNT